MESARFLVEQGAGHLVIACNTASALALPEIRAAVNVLVLGVVETGADAAKKGSETGDVLVIATTATVASHAYRAACEARGLRALEKACPLLVPLVEEGWVDHQVTRDVLEIYLGELGEAADANAMEPDALVLGCTHYPLLRAEIEDLVPPGLRVIDSAEVTARAVAGVVEAASGAAPPIRFFATDGLERFRGLGSRFLGEPVRDVRLVDLGG